MRLPPTPYLVSGVLGAGLLWWLWPKGTEPIRPPLPPNDRDPLSVPPGSGRKYTAHLSDQFFRDVDAYAEALRSRGATITGEDFLGVLKAESGVDPKSVNSIGCAGMNQICDLSSIKWPGTRAQYAALSAEEQWPWVQKWFENNLRGREKRLTDMGRLYLLNFNPGNFNEPDSTVLYRRRTDGPEVTASNAEWAAWTKAHSKPPDQDVYALNRGVDVQKKGYIEVADMDRFVKRSLAWGPKGAGQWEFWSELRGRLEQARKNASLISGLTIGPYSQFVGCCGECDGNT